MRLGSVAAVVLFAAGCYDPDVKLGIPCSATGECPNGQECDSITNTCLEPTQQFTWRDDTAADFTKPDAVMQDTIVEASGFVGPVPYATGDVRISGVQGDHIANAVTTTWADVDLARTGVGFSPTLLIDYGPNVPGGVNLTAGDDVTVLVEGEIYLDVAGAWRFELYGNDSAFVDLAPPGGDFTRLVSDTLNSTVVNYSVPTPGWYRFRGAFADAAMNMRFRLRYDPPNVFGGLIDVPADHLRVRVDDLQGYVFDGFDDAYLMAYQGSTLLTTPLDLSVGADPYGLNIGVQSWSVRAAGQFLIDKEGDYAFTITSHHGHRAWIDGALVANQFGSADVTTDVPARHLVAGWHDLVADLTKSNTLSDGTLSVVVASGPDFAGQPIPVDHMRPVIGRGARWTEAHDSTATTITDGASLNRTLNLVFPANMTPFEIHQETSFTHADWAQVGLTVNPPAGADIVLAAPGSMTGSGGHDIHTVVPNSDIGLQWVLTATDSTIDTVVGTLDMFAVTVLYAGGTPPFASTYRYESAPKDLGNVVGIGAVSWQSRQGDAKIQVRTCDDAAACAAETWLDVPASGGTPAVTPKRFMQYAVDLTSDGDTPTALDWIEIAYSARP